MRLRCPECDYEFAPRPMGVATRLVRCPDCGERFAPSSPDGPSNALLLGGFFAGIVVLATAIVAVVWFTTRPDDRAEAPITGPVESPRPAPERPVVRPAPQPAPPKPPADGLPPLPTPLPITPTWVTEKTAYALPAPATQVSVAGGGRYLLLWFWQLKKVGVFDVTTAKIERFIAVPDESPMLAGGMHKLVVYSPTDKTLERFDLRTGEREKTVPARIWGDERVTSFCLGHASAGPLLVTTAKQARLLDIDTFEEIELSSPFPFRDGYYWAGGTGRVFGHTGNYGQPSGIDSFVFESGGYKYYHQHEAPFAVIPGPDDKHLYPLGYGVVSVKVEALQNVAFSMGRNRGYVSNYYLPSAHGPYYFHAQMIRGIDGKTEPAKGTLRVFRFGSAEPLLSTTDIPLPDYDRQGGRVYHSMHLIPAAKLFVVVDVVRDKLHLYPIDLDAALEKAGRDYVFVTSTPPAKYTPGVALSYQITVKAKDAPVSFKLEAGPNGMTIDPTGLLRWTPPAGTANRQTVLVLLADKKDTEEFHAFELTASQ